MPKVVFLILRENVIFSLFRFPAQGGVVCGSVGSVKVDLRMIFIGNCRKFDRCNCKKFYLDNCRKLSLIIGESFSLIIVESLRVIIAESSH